MLPVNWYPACSAVTAPAKPEMRRTMNRLPDPDVPGLVIIRGTPDADLAEAAHEIHHARQARKSRQASHQR